MHIEIYFISWFSVYVKQTTRMVGTVCALFCSSVVLWAALHTPNEMKIYCGVTNGKIQQWLFSSLLNSVSECCHRVNICKENLIKFRFLKNKFCTKNATFGSPVFIKIGLDKMCKHFIFISL